MASTSRPDQDHLDPENFPPAGDGSDILPQSLEMPEFITDAQLRKGPRKQNTLMWMNAVQAHLDDLTSWDRRMDGTLAMRVHQDIKTCQIARINPRHIRAGRKLKKPKYIKEELEPAIKLLVDQEQIRKRDHIKPEPQENDEKRKHEEDDDDDETPPPTKKRKQDTDKELVIIVDDLQFLCKLVDGKMETVDVEVRQGFHKLEGKVLELMAVGTEE